MRLRYWLLIFAAYFFNLTPACAQQDQLLTLQRAVDLAYSSNPGLVATQRDIGIAQAQIEQAGVIPNPELAALTEGVDRGRRTTTVQINQLIELGGKRSSRIGVAERDQEAATALLAKQRSDVRAQVIGLFFDVLNAQERVQLAQASYQLAQQVSSVVKRRVAAGRISPIEATRISVAELTIKTELEQAKTELTVAKNRLASMWGAIRPTFTEAVKPEAGEVISLERDYTDLSRLQARLEKSPQLRSAQIEIQRQEAQEDLERSRRFSDLTVSVGSKRNERESESETVLGISIPIPLFDRNQGNVLAALRKTDKARDELYAIGQQLRNELVQAWQRYQTAQAQSMTLQNDILPQAESAVAATVKGFEFGKFSFMDVQDAQNTLVQTKLQYLTTQADLYRSIADIERLVGTDQPRIAYEIN